MIELPLRMHILVHESLLLIFLCSLKQGSCIVKGSFGCHSLNVQVSLGNAFVAIAFAEQFTLTVHLEI